MASEEVRSTQRPASTRTASPSSAAPPGPRSSPEALRVEESQPQAATLSRAYTYVEEAVPGRSTALLLALVGGILALLVLIAREWIR